jgi:hypothetical protein
MPINKQVEKCWYMHTIEYFKAIKRNEVLINTTTRMKFGSVIVSKRSQTQRSHIV